MGKNVCQVDNCYHRKDKTNKSFFYFPRNTEKRKLWCEALKLKFELMTPHKVVCSDHFENYQLKKCNGRNRIQPGAIPSLAVNEQDTQEQGDPTENLIRTTVRDRDPCSVMSCRRSEENSVGRKCFEFPKNEKRRREWCEALGLRFETVTSRQKICSKHFSSQQLHRRNGKIRIVANSIPSLVHNAEELNQESQPVVAQPFSKVFQPEGTKLTPRLPTRGMNNIDHGNDGTATKVVTHEEGIGNSTSSPLRKGEGSTMKIKAKAPPGRHYCKVLNCLNSREKCPTKSFFQFPRNTLWRRRWCETLGLNFAETSIRGLVCSEHFHPEQIITVNGRKRLKENSVPRSQIVSIQEPGSPKTLQIRIGSSSGIKGCKAFNCGSRGDDSTISFFSFPKEPSRREEWCRRLEINFKDCNFISQRICQKHFKRSQFKNSSRNRLVENALPFIPSGSDQKQGLVEEKRTSDTVINTTKTVPVQSFVASIEVNSVSKTIQASHIKRIRTCTATTIPFQKIVSDNQPTGLLIPQQVQQPELLTPQTQQMEWVFAGMGINEVPCLRQVQVSQPSPLQPNPNVLASTIHATSHADNTAPVLSSLSDLILKTGSNITEDETIIESDLNKRCLMCNGNARSLSSDKGIDNYFKILIIENVFEILNLTRLIEDDLNIDPNEVPFCIDCLCQIDDMIKVHDELVILQERFEILKTGVLYSFMNSFCQRKGLEEEDELTKDFYQNTDICNKMMNLLGSRTRTRSAQVLASSFPNDAEIKDKQNIVLQRDAHESYSNQMNFETTDFELEDIEGFNPDFILSNSSDPLAIPIEDIGKVEICFEGKGLLREKEKWEALSKCPETKEGLEMLLPRQYRRIICPICKKKVTPLKMSKHLKLFHPERKDIAEIESKLLSESTKIISGMERKKIMKDKWKTLSNYTKKHNKNDSHIPAKFRKVNCPICNKEVSALAIASHINIHTGEKPFKCSKCPKAFAKSSSLSRHRFVHMKKNPFQNHFYFCDLCSYGGKLCQLKSNYVRHVLNAHSTEVGVNDVLYFYNCDAKDCVHSYRQKDEFLKHIKTHGDVFLCQHKDCGKVFADSVNYKSHCTLFHTTHTGKESGGQDGKLFYCKYCPLISKDKNEWEIHELTHGIDMSTEQRTHLCDECGAGFKTHLLLWYHKRSTHKRSLQKPMEKMSKLNTNKCLSDVRIQNLGINYQLKTCQVCEKRFYSKRLTNHLLDVHTYENRLYCYICKQTFKSITYLESHIRRHLGQPRKTSKAKCIYCGIEFPTIIPLRKHCIQEHSEQCLTVKPFYCPVCWLLFETEEEGTTHHLKFHEQWRCKVCGKQLRNKYVYERHVKIHSGETPYECKVCQKRFIILGNCKEHEMRHFGEKPFYCEFCNKGFFRKKLLKTHIEIEHSIG